VFDIVVKRFTYAISSSDEFLSIFELRLFYELASMCANVRHDAWSESMCVRWWSTCAATNVGNRRRSSAVDLHHLCNRILCQEVSATPRRWRV